MADFQKARFHIQAAIANMRELGIGVDVVIYCGPTDEGRMRKFAEGMQGVTVSIDFSLSGGDYRMERKP